MPPLSLARDAADDAGTDFLIAPKLGGHVLQESTAVLRCERLRGGQDDLRARRRSG